MKYVVQTEADWLELRKKYITASNAAVLVGADPYSSVAKIKNPDPFFGNAYTFVGQMLEPVVVNVVNKVLGTSFELYETAGGAKEFYTQGYFGATPDAHMDRKVLLECKTTRPHTMLKYGVVPPNKYLIQLIVQMMCVGVDTGYLAIMSTNLTQVSAKLIWPVSIYAVNRDVRICNILIAEAERFAKCATFRVNSAVKQQVKLLLSACYMSVTK